MSRKHNTKHTRRGRSNYPRRLAKRGLSNVDVRMPDLESLRKSFLRREASHNGVTLDERVA